MPDRYILRKCEKEIKMTNQNILAKSKKGKFEITEEGGILHAFMVSGDKREEIGEFSVQKDGSEYIVNCGQISDVKDREQRKEVWTALMVLGLLLHANRLKEVLLQVDDISLPEDIKRLGGVEHWEMHERMFQYPAKKIPTYFKFILNKEQLDLLESKKIRLIVNWDTTGFERYVRVALREK